MNPTLSPYLIQVTLWWIVFYLFYVLIVSKKGTAHESRVFLNLTLFGGVLLPFIPWPIPASALISMPLPEFTLTESISLTSASVENGFSWFELITLGYWLGVAYLCIKRCTGLYQIHRIQGQSQRRNLEGERVYIVPELPSPFQFAGTLYLPAALEKDKDGFQLAFQHERAHRQYRHSIDLGLGSLIQIIFWPHPLVNMLLKALRMVHEYQADEAVVHVYPRERYVRFIGTFRNLQPISLPIHTIQQGPLKKRIMNMYQSRRPLRIKHWAGITLAGLLLISLTAMNKKATDNLPYLQSASLILSDTIPASKAPPAPPANASNVKPPVPPAPPEAPKAPKPPGEERFFIAEEMPRFPGCEDVTNKKERDQCAQQKLMAYLGANLTYPAEAKLKGIEGTCIVQFIVEKDGSISNVEIAKEIGSGTGAEVLRLFEKMVKDGIRWIPGQEKGKKIRIQYSLPIKFQLASTKK
ncbi:MAG: TonB family protein [Saprospiraceae bacterium]|nr:TonB family protein [Saprospiraceae bacterium]